MGALTPLQASLAGFEQSLRRMAAQQAPSAPAPPWPERIEARHFEARTVSVSEPWGVSMCMALDLVLSCRASGCCDGQVYERQGQYPIPRPCVCNRWRKAALAVRSAHIPAEFAAVAPLAPPAPTAEERARLETLPGEYRWSWLANGPAAQAEVERCYGRDEGMLLVGPAGDGKSHLAIAILLRRLLAGESGRWWSWRTYCEACNEAHYGRVGQLRPSDIAAAALAGRWLVLDDLWVNTGLARDEESDIRLQVARLHDLLDRARQAGTRLIATSNVPLVALRDRAADHVMSRLEAAMTEVRIVGPDRRREAKRKKD